MPISRLLLHANTQQRRASLDVSTADTLFSAKATSSYESLCRLYFLPEELVVGCNLFRVM